MQRTKVRDYYDVWKIFSSNVYGFDTVMITKMIKQKCSINNRKYDPYLIFNNTRLGELEKYWKMWLDVLVVEDLPEFDKVFDDIKIQLAFLYEDD